MIRSVPFSYRRDIGRGFYLGGVFAHLHEISWKQLDAEAVDAVLGTQHFIVQHSGWSIQAEFAFPAFYKKGM